MVCPPPPQCPVTRPTDVKPETMDAMLLPPLLLPLLLEVPARDGVSIMGKAGVFGYVGREVGKHVGVECQCMNYGGKVW